jgi:hypothetical protein
MMTKKLVLYHKNCTDGFVAAAMAYLVLGAEDVIYQPTQYGEALPDLSTFETVYILDYSIFPVPENAVMLDHHATAMAKFGYPDASYYSTPEPFVVIDIMKSGARLAQEYFKVGEQWIVDYAEDHDLWRFKLSNSRALRAGLNMLPRNDIITDAPVWLAADIYDVRANGERIIAYEQTIIERIVDNALDLVIDIGGGVVYDCKMINSSTLISDVGNRICERYEVPVACMWFQTGPGTVVVSLRGENVRVIAEAFGGGGHDASAGFRLTDWEQIKQLVHGKLSRG